MSSLDVLGSSAPVGDREASASRGLELAGEVRSLVARPSLNVRRPDHHQEWVIHGKCVYPTSGSIPPLFPLGRSSTRFDLLPPRLLLPDALAKPLLMSLNASPCARARLGREEWTGQVN